MIALIIGILIILVIVNHDKSQRERLEKDDREKNTQLERESLERQLKRLNNETRILQIIERIRQHQLLYEGKKVKQDCKIRLKDFYDEIVDFYPFRLRRDYFLTYINTRKKDYYRQIKIKEKYSSEMEIFYTIRSSKTYKEISNSILIDLSTNKKDDEYWSLYMNLFEETEDKFNETSLLK